MLVAFNRFESLYTCIMNECAEIVERQGLDARRSDFARHDNVHRGAMAFLIGLGMPEERVDIEIG